MKSKIVSISVVTILLVVLMVGASLAFFSDKETKTNTFVMGKGIDISLDEHAEKITLPDGTLLEAGEALKDSDQNITGYKYTLIPGAKYHKEPIVKVAADSRTCYLVATVTINQKAKLYAFYKEKRNAASKVCQPDQTNPQWLSLAGNGALVSGGVSDWKVKNELKSGTCFASGYGNMLTADVNDANAQKVYVEYEEPSGRDTIVYTYYFMNQVAAGTSYSLFYSVNTPTTLTGSEADTALINGLKVTVDVYGLQTDGYADVKAAWTAYNAD